MNENPFEQLLQSNLVPDIDKDDKRMVGKEGYRRVLRATQVDMAEIKADIDAHGLPTHLMIFADEIVFPDECALSLRNCRAVFFARKLRINTDITITIAPGAVTNETISDGDGNYPLMIYTSADDLTDDFVVNVQVQPPAKEGENTEGRVTTYNLKEQLQLQASVGLAFGIQSDGSASVATRNTGSYSGNTDLATLLQAQFQYAMTTYDSDRAMTESLLAWIENVGRNWPLPTGDGYDPVPDLYVQSASLRMLLTATSGGARYVPSLTDEVYSKLAKSYYNAAKDYELKYIALSSADQADRYETAQTLLQAQQAQDQVEFYDNLLKQTKDNYDNARKAHQAIRERLRAQKFETELAQIALKHNIESWKDDQYFNIAKDGLFALIEFGTGVAGLVAGNPAGAGGAAKGAEDAGKAVANAATAGEEAKKMGEKLKQLKSLMEKIIKLVSTTNDLIVRSQEVAKFAAGEVPLPDKPTILPGTIPDQSVWQEFIITAESVIKPAIDEGIDGAQDYLDGLKVFAYQAQALANSQHNLITIEQEWVRQQLQKQNSQRQLERLQNYVGQLQKEEVPILDMMQLFYMRYLSLKRSLFVALQYHTWAYFYEALKQSSVQPSMSVKIADIDTTTVKLTEDYVKGLFPKTPPTEFQTITLHLAPQFESYDKGKVMNCLIPLTQEQFNLFDRVRLDSIWVYLEGATSKRSDEQIPVFISNTDTYRDRYNDQEFVFTTEKYQQLFTYVINEDGKYGANNYAKYHNVKDTKIEQKSAYVYFRPTPFAEWALQVETSAVDLSNVTEVVMVFNGSAIGHTS